MKNINQFIIEKFKININNIKKSNEPWSIENAEDGDIVELNETLLFIYKGLNKDFHVNNAGSNAIVYHATYICDNRKLLKVGIDTGVGTIDKPDRYKLASKEKCEEFYEELKKKGYKWDNKKLKIVEI